MLSQNRVPKENQLSKYVNLVKNHNKGLIKNLNLNKNQDQSQEKLTVIIIIKTSTALF